MQQPVAIRQLISFFQRRRSTCNAIHFHYIQSIFNFSIDGR